MYEILQEQRKKNYWSLLCWVSFLAISAIQRLKQKDCYESKDTGATQ